MREVVGGSEFAGCGGVSGVFGADDEGEWQAEWDEAKSVGGWACGEKMRKALRMIEDLRGKLGIA